MIYATDGWTYLQFPSESWCCKCENEFGSVRYDWLQDNATYVGISTVNGLPSYEWEKWGAMLNHYYSSVKGSLPVQYWELDVYYENKLKAWNFQLDTYSTAGFDMALIQPPPNCETLCQVCFFALLLAPAPDPRSQPPARNTETLPPPAQPPTESSNSSKHITTNKHNSGLDQEGTLIEFSKGLAYWTHSYLWRRPAVSRATMALSCWLILAYCGTS